MGQFAIAGSFMLGASRVEAHSTELQGIYNLVKQSCFSNRTGQVCLDRLSRLCVRAEQFPFPEFMEDFWIRCHLALLRQRHHDEDGANQHA